MSIEVGDIIEGRVVGIKDFGAFIELPDNKIGFLHISEIEDAFIKDIKAHIKEKDIVKAKIISITKDGKINLSIKQVKEKRRDILKRIKGKEESELSFEEKMAKFLRDSDERQLDLKRNIEAKRAGGKKK